MGDELPRDLRRELDGVHAAHGVLAERLGALTDAQARQPSLLPGWTVGHVVTHLARNADGMRNMLAAAADGEVAAQYPGGAEQRTSDIEAGAHRSADELVADLVASATALETAAGALSAEQWATGQGTAFGRPLPIADVPFRRRREALVHLHDCGLGEAEGWSDWPVDFVRAELVRITLQWAGRRPMGIMALPPEAMGVPDGQRLAWLYGRATIPGLEPAGAM